MNGGIVINVPSHTNLKDIPFEGVLRIYSPLWVDGIPIDNLLDKTEYYLMNAFSECTSSELVINSENYMSDAVGDYLAFYTLRYKLPASAKLESTGFTITCSKVRMPTYRQASVKFMLEFTSQISQKEVIGGFLQFFLNTETFTTRSIASELIEVTFNDVDNNNLLNEIEI